MNIIEEVKSYYRCNQEYYHTIHHIESMIGLMDQYWCSFIEEYPEYIDRYHLFELAIAYHDCVYIPGSQTNEIDSANLFLAKYPNNKLVYNAILSTSIGSNQNNGLELFIHDLDWIGFSDYKTLLINESKIFNEFIDVGHFSKEQCYEGQLKFYQSLIGKTIYHTNSFRNLNEPTQINLNKRINQMMEGASI